jgi:hypothetical protein
MPEDYSKAEARIKDAIDTMKHKKKAKYLALCTLI